MDLILCFNSFLRGSEALRQGAPGVAVQAQPVQALRRLRHQLFHGRLKRIRRELFKI